MIDPSQGPRRRKAPRARGRSLALVVAVAAAGAVGVSGCGGGGASVATTSTGPGPGIVAVDYTEALFAGHFAAAEADVAPASRNALRVVELGLRSSSVRAQHLAPGSVRTSGNEASVVLTGTLCSSHTDARAAAKAGADCITNHDRRSTDPIFGVALERAATGAWQVVYRMPSQTSPS